jgi:hypothetical protein
MVSHFLSIAALIGSAAEVLFERFKAGFYFPSRSKIPDHPELIS